MKKTYPTIKTLLMVEQFLSKHKEDLFSKSAIIRGLSGKINNPNLTTILEYLEASNKILSSSKGIQWIASNGKKAQELMKEALII
jgi:hypothetical protein